MVLCNTVLATALLTKRAPATRLMLPFARTEALLPSVSTCEPRKLKLVGATTLPIWPFTVRSPSLTAERLALVEDDWLLMLPVKKRLPKLVIRVFPVRVTEPDSVRGVLAELKSAPEALPACVEPLPERVSALLSELPLTSMAAPEPPELGATMTAPLPRKLVDGLTVKELEGDVKVLDEEEVVEPLDDVNPGGVPTTSNPDSTRVPPE